MLHFWLNKGLVGAGLVDKYSFMYWVISLIAVGVQVGTMKLVSVLNRKHFG